MSAKTSSKPVFGSVTLVHGSEQLLSERAVAALRKRAMAEEPGLQLVELVGGDMSPADFVEASGGSLFADHSLVIITGAESMVPESVDALVAFAGAPSPEVGVIVVHPGGNKGRGLVDKLRKAKAGVVEVVAPKAWELPKFVQAEARAARVGMESDAAQTLVDAVGNDLRALAGAVSQLASDWAGERLSSEMISRYFQGRAEVTSFAVSDALLAGQTGQALERLRWALDLGVAPVLVTSALANGLRSLGRYLDVRAERMSDIEMSRIVGVPPWKVKTLARQSRLWSETAVARGLIALSRADAAVKGAATDAGFALEQLILALDHARRDDASGHRRSAGVRRR